MLKNADITFNENRFLVSGDLNFSNVMSVYENSLNQLHHCRELRFDFSQLRSSDSSGLALIMEWIKFARQHQKAVHFSHLSQDLMSLAKVSGLDKIIPNHM